MKVGTLILVAGGLLCGAALAWAQTADTSTPGPAATNPTSQPATTRANEKAEQMFAAKNYAQAVIYFQEAIRLNPKDAQIWVEMGDAYRQWGLTNADVASSGKDAECYLRALQVDPDNIDALSRVMTLYADQVEFRHHAEDFEGLKNTADKIVRLHPTDADLDRRAQAYAAIAPLAKWLYGIAVPPEEVEEHIKALVELMKEDKFDSDVPYYLAQSYLNQAMEKRRLGQIDEARNKFHEARAVFEEAIKAQPASPRLLVRFYLWLTQANQKAQSEDLLPQAAQYVQRMQEVLTQARVLVDAATEKNAKGTGQDAGDLQGEGLASYTDVYSYAVEFANRHPERGLGKEAAMNLAKHWLEVRPGDQTARLSMAGLLEAENDPAKREQAIALLEQPITDPGGAGIGVFRSRKSLELSTELRLINLLIEQWTRSTDALAQASMRQKIDDAFKQCSKILGPGSYDCIKLEGRIQLQAGGAEGAVNAVPILMKAETIRQQTGMQDLDLDWLLAQAYEKAHQNGDAEARLAKIVKHMPTFVLARILYVHVLLKDGKLGEADKQIIELEKQAPDDPTVKELQIQRLLRSANPEDRARIPGLVAPYETKNMTKAQVLAVAGALWSAGETDHAVTILESARRQSPTDFDIVQRLVWIYLANHHKDLAQKLVEGALNAAPDDANFKVLKLSLDGASADLIRAAQREGLNQIKDPLTRELRFFDFEMTLEDPQAALRHLENAEKLSPDDKQVLELRFRISLQLQQWDRAEAMIKKLAAQNADEAQGRIYQFRLAMARGDTNMALAVARQLVSEMPTFACPHLCLAQALQVSNQFEAAIKEYKNANEAQSSVEALLGMINCYYALKQPGEALICILRGLQLSPNDAGFAEPSMRNYLMNDPDPKPEVMAALLRAGADLNAKDKDGITPLMDAAQCNSNPDVIAALLKAGADPKAQDKDGKTPLMHAVLNPNPDVVAALLKAGADVNAKDNSAKTALDYAREKNNSEAAAALIQAGAKEK